MHGGKRSYGCGVGMYGFRRKNLPQVGVLGKFVQHPQLCQRFCRSVNRYGVLVQKYPQPLDVVGVGMGNTDSLHGFGREPVSLQRLHQFTAGGSGIDQHAAGRAADKRGVALTGTEQRIEFRQDQISSFPQEKPPTKLTAFCI